MTALDSDFPYLSEEKDRHGTGRLYVRRYGRRIRIREERGTSEFPKAYSKALDKLTADHARKPAVKIVAAARGTLGWLAAEYFATGVKGTARGVIEACLQETIKDGSSDTFRDLPLPAVSTKKVKRLRDLKTGLPGAANNRRKYLSAMFSWAIEAEHMTSNPARDIQRIQYASEGFHTWTLDEVRQFRDHHPIGTKARLAVEMLLFIGMRRGDFVKIGRQHVKGTELRFIPRKTRHVKVEAIEMPLLPPTLEAMAAVPAGDLTYLVTEYGRPFTAAGFGGKFRGWCDQAKLPQCSAHGLRKAGATIAADMGATVHQLMAMYGWSSPQQAMVYTRKANRKKLAREGVALLARGMEDEQNCRTENLSHRSGTVAPKENQ